MSGIYISGMEMPKTCCYCPLMGYDPDREWNDSMARTGAHICVLTGALIDNTKREGHCPLVPVPDHGRIIDADALTGQMERNLWAIEDKAEKELGFNETLRRGMQYGHAVCVDAVNAAPTISPADNEVVSVNNALPFDDRNVNWKPLTKVDSIRSMTDEELANQLVSEQYVAMKIGLTFLCQNLKDEGILDEKEAKECFCNFENEAKKRWGEMVEEKLDWLKAPVEASP